MHGHFQVAVQIDRLRKGPLIGKLREQAFKGSMWMGGGNLAIRVLTIVTGILLARLLNVADFGLVALAHIVLATTSLFSSLGLGSALIQSTEHRPTIAFHAFVFTAGLGLLLLAVLELFAGSFASLLGDPAVEPILRWLSLLVVLNGLTIVPEALLQKELLFQRITLATLVTELVYISTALFLAFTGYGVWSLVVAALLKTCVYAILIWSVAPGWEWVTPKRWDWGVIGRLLRFGVQLAGSGLTVFLYTTADSFVVGKMLGTWSIGFYSRAYDFSVRTVLGFSAVIGTVLLPSYSKIQHDLPRLARAYLKSLNVIALFTVPMAAGLFILGPELIAVLLGAKWVPMTETFKVLSLVGLILPLSASTAALFSAVGRPGYNLRAGLVVIALLLPGIFLLLPFESPGVAGAVLIAHIGGFAFNIYQVERTLKGTARGMFSAVRMPVAASIGMMLATAIIKEQIRQFVGGTQTVITVGVIIVVGVFVYGAAIFALQRSVVLEILLLALGRDGFRKPPAEQD